MNDKDIQDDFIGRIRGRGFSAPQIVAERIEESPEEFKRKLQVSAESVRTLSFHRDLALELRHTETDRINEENLYNAYIDYNKEHGDTFTQEDKDWILKTLQRRDHTLEDNEEAVRNYIFTRYTQQKIEQQLKKEKQS